MQLLYEKPAEAGLTPDRDQLDGPDRGQLPLPILLRVPRFAFLEAPSPSAPSTPASVENVAAKSPARHHKAALGSKFRTGRRRRQMIGLVAIGLIVMPVAVVSRDPNLMAPLIERWCGERSGGEPVLEFTDHPENDSAVRVTTAHSDVHPNRSAWLESDILPFKPGEAP
jgi:hypothetical protein